MNHVILKKGSTELLPFPHIAEFAIQKNTTIKFDSLQLIKAEAIKLYYIIEGKFEWVIEKEHYILYPGDLAIILPGQSSGGDKNFLDIGTITWLHVQPDDLSADGKMVPGKWSSLTENESKAIGKILVLNTVPVLSRMKEAGILFYQIQHELLNQEIGYGTRANHLLDDLFIIIARQLTRQNSSRRDFPQTFMKLEQNLRDNLMHQWTVEEMAALVGLGTTAFSEKVKSFTGFSPLNYLINIRISEAIKLLKRADVNVTDIALDTGFYSSQHFATTFKKLTGYTPSEFRKRNI